MSELERERKREREKEEVTEVQLFTEKVHLRSSDSFVLSGDILFTCFLRAALHFSFPSFRQHFNSSQPFSKTLSKACPGFPGEKTKIPDSKRNARQWK